MKDPTQAIAEEHLATLAIDVIVQLERGTEMRPVLWLLDRARKQASAALVKFLTIDPTDVEGVRKLQNTINRYDDYVVDMRALVARGREADQLISEEDRAEIEQLLNPSPDEE